MPRGNDTQSKVHYQGRDEDFVIFIDDVETMKKWKDDKSIPLAQVVSGFKIFVTHKQGAQGILDTASNAALENEFGTSRDDDVIQKILEGGSIQEVENRERQGPTNDSMSSMRTK